MASVAFVNGSVFCAFFLQYITFTFCFSYGLHSFISSVYYLLKMASQMVWGSESHRYLDFKVSPLFRILLVIFFQIKKTLVFPLPFTQHNSQTLSTILTYFRSFRFHQLTIANRCVHFGYINKKND